MKLKLLVTALIGLGSVVAMAGSASADIVCNGEHECWHTTEHATYPHGIVVHHDDWKWKGERYKWHEHDGRGYWKGGVWVTL